MQTIHTIGLSCLVLSLVVMYSVHSGWDTVKLSKHISIGALICGMVFGYFVLKTFDVRATTKPKHTSIYLVFASCMTVASLAAIVAILF
jgi:hypothetical protein